MRVFCSTWYCCYALWYWTLLIVGHVCMCLLIGGTHFLLFNYPWDGLFFSMVFALILSWIFTSWLPFSFILIGTERKEWQPFALLLSGCVVGVLSGIISLALISSYPTERDVYYRHLLAFLHSEKYDGPNTVYPLWITKFQVTRKCCGLKGQSDYRRNSSHAEFIPPSCQVGSVLTFLRSKGESLNAEEHSTDSVQDHFTPKLTPATPAETRQIFPTPSYYTTGCLEYFIEERDYRRRLLLALNGIMIVGAVGTFLATGYAFWWLHRQEMVILTERVRLANSNDNSKKGLSDIDQEELISANSSGTGILP